MFYYFCYFLCNFNDTQVLNKYNDKHIDILFSF